MASSGNHEMLAGWIKNDNKVVKFRYEWTIMDFEHVPTDEDHMLDTISSKNSNIGDEWKAKFRIEQYRGRNDGLIFTVTPYIYPKIPILVRFRLMILRRDIVVISKSRDAICGQYDNPSPIFNMAIKEFNFNSIYLVNGNLTIACEVTLISNRDDIISYIEKNEKVICPIQENYLSCDMELLFNNQKCGNFTFKFGDKELRASRDILSARSPVFASMLDEESDFKENRDNYVDILDIDYEVFRQMLFYIYTDKAPELNRMAEGLLAAAEKYQLKGLKAICEIALCQKLTIGNALDILILSDTYKCQQLKFHTVGFIVMHKKDVLESNKYKSLLITNPAQVKDLIFEIFNREGLVPKSEINCRKIVTIKKIGTNGS